MRLCSATRLLRTLAARRVVHGHRTNSHSKEFNIAGSRQNIDTDSALFSTSSIYDSTTDSYVSSKAGDLAKGRISDIPNRTTKSQPCLTNLSGTPAHALTARALAAGMSPFCQLERSQNQKRRTFVGYTDWAEDDLKQRNLARTRISEQRLTSHSQPCLHPPSWSHPQVRLEHLPSVLP